MGLFFYYFDHFTEVVEPHFDGIEEWALISVDPFECNVLDLPIQSALEVMSEDVIIGTHLLYAVEVRTDQGSILGVGEVDRFGVKAGLFVLKDEVVVAFHREEERPTRVNLSDNSLMSRSSPDRFEERDDGLLDLTVPIQEEHHVVVPTEVDEVFGLRCALLFDDVPEVVLSDVQWDDITERPRDGHFFQWDTVSFIQQDRFFVAIGKGLVLLAPKEVEATL